MKTEAVGLLVIEPSLLIREGLKTVLSQMRVAFRMEEADVNVRDLTRLLHKTAPNIVVLNPDLLPPDCIINRVGNQMVFIGLISRNSHKSGQFDFVLEHNSSRQEIIAVLEEALKKAGLCENSNDNVSLSDRETEVLKWVALGLTNNEISEKLFISTHTVMTHRKNITRKLEIKTVSGLTVYAILIGIIKPEELKGTMRPE